MSSTGMPKAVIVIGAAAAAGAAAAGLYSLWEYLVWRRKRLSWQEIVTNRRYLPRRIILVRHGQSLGNVDETVFTHTPDWK